MLDGAIAGTYTHGALLSARLRRPGGSSSRKNNTPCVWEGFYCHLVVYPYVNLVK